MRKDVWLGWIFRTTWKDCSANDYCLIRYAHHRAAQCFQMGHPSRAHDTHMEEFTTNPWHQSNRTRPERRFRVCANRHRMLSFDKTACCVRSFSIHQLWVGPCGNLKRPNREHHNWQWVRDIKKATLSFDFGRRIACMAHNLNLVVKRGLCLWKKPNIDKPVMFVSTFARYSILDGSVPGSEHLQLCKRAR